MPASVPLPDSLKRFLARRPRVVVKKINAEASQRRFLRIVWGKQSCVAMVYPGPNPADVSRFLRLRAAFEKYGLAVPRLIEALDDQVLILEDAGDILLQRAWRESNNRERRRLLAGCRDLLSRLAALPSTLAVSRLDRARQLLEMDFFLKHFFPRYPVRGSTEAKLQPLLITLVDAIEPECVFAHRDFHSRNLLVCRGRIVMVDFQDSLLAPRYYDLVSLAFDSYLDLGLARGGLFPNLAASGDDWELRQVRLTALQRNIKALGTFAYQTHARKHPAYARYIPRTIRHIRSHLQALADPKLAVLFKYFSKLS